MAAITLDQIAIKMKAYFDRAPGPYHAAWWKFVDESLLFYHAEPLQRQAKTIETAQFFSDYWLEVAEAKNDDYDPLTGHRLSNPSF
jgi:hypothetical protein